MMGVEYICVAAIYIRERCLCDTFAFPIFFVYFLLLLFSLSRCATRNWCSIFVASAYPVRYSALFFLLNVLLFNRELHHCDLNQMSFELYFTTLIFHSNDFISDFTSLSWFHLERMIVLNFSDLMFPFEIKEGKRTTNKWQAKQKTDVILTSIEKAMKIEWLIARKSNKQQ